MPVISHTEVKLNRAIALLAQVMGEDRVFLNDPGAREVLATGEQERAISYESVGKDPGFSGILKGPQHPDDFQIGPHTLDDKGRPLRFNSNRLTKLSSGIVINTTAAIMVVGLSVDATGARKPSMDEELAVATLLYNVIDRQKPGENVSALPALLHEDRMRIDEVYIAEKFGTKILGHIQGIRTAVDRLDAGQDIADVRAEHLNAVTAIQAARVREAAKIVSVDLINRLHPDAQSVFLIENNLASSRPAQELLTRETEKLQKLLQRRGIAAEIREPIEQTLLPAIEAYRKDPDNKKWELWGNPEDGRGTAYAHFNQALPINRYQTDEGHLNSLDTYKALLLITRYHQDTVRKDGSSILSHVMDVHGFGSRTLEDNLRTHVSLVLLMHDLIEDGGTDVSHKNANFNLIVKAFGDRTAVTIAEMTDDVSKSLYVMRAQGAAREITGQHNFAEQLAGTIQQRGLASQVGEDALNTAIVQILTGSTFSLTTAGPKLADVVSTIQKNLEQPQKNLGYWRGSGARIGWIVDDKSKGYVGQELYASVAASVLAFFANPSSNKHEQALISGHKAGELNEGLLKVLQQTKESFDKYTLQNLIILADEFKLEEAKRQELIARFVDKTEGAEHRLREFLDVSLLPENLVTQSMDMTTLYQRGSTPELPKRSYQNLIRLRTQFLMREAYRESLLALAELPTNQCSAAHIANAMANPVFTAKPYQDVVTHYHRQMEQTERVMLAPDRSPINNLPLFSPVV